MCLPRCQEVEPSSAVKHESLGGSDLLGGETWTDPQGGCPSGCRLTSGGSGPKSVSGSSWMNSELGENGKDTVVFRLVQASRE
jgi:hypothetical protein